MTDFFSKKGELLIIHLRETSSSQFLPNAITAIAVIAVIAAITAITEDLDLCHQNWNRHLCQEKTPRHRVLGRIPLSWKVLVSGEEIWTR